VTLPSLATRVRRVLDETQVPRGARILVACSGGLDSQVLLDVLAHVARDGRVSILAHGVDHGLRAEATDELELAARLCRDRGVEFAVTRVVVGAGGNLQARARTQRYDALHAAAERGGASFVATAHHLDDRAETILIRILRGAPLAGLAVLPPRSHESPHDRLRPLFRARKSELQAHAAKRSIPFALDPSNLDRRSLRVRVRLDVLPLLRTLDPRIDDHLVRIADDAIAHASARSGAPDGHAPPSPVPAALVQALAARRASTRAVSALHDAAIMRNSRARVRLAANATARWDALDGIVITTTPVRAAARSSARRG
jgi:tRNA(Ile)-lysidine synthase